LVPESASTAGRTTPRDDALNSAPDATAVRGVSPNGRIGADGADGWDPQEPRRAGGSQEDAPSAAPKPAEDGAARETLDVAAGPSAEESLLVHEIALAAAGEEDLSRILSGALDRLRARVKFTGGSISLIEGDDLVLSAAIGPFTSRAVGQRLPRGTGQSWKVVESQEPWICDDLVAAGFQIRGVAREGGPRAYIAVPLVRGGEPIGLLQIDSTEPAVFSAADLGLMHAVATALTGPIELARRHAREAAALADSEAAKARVSLLAEASSVLGSSLDYEETLNRVAHLAIPLLGTYCVVDLTEESGSTRQIAVAHVDPAYEPLLREIRARYPFDPDQPYGVTNVIRTGKPEIRNGIDARWMESAARDARHLVLLRELAFTAYAIVPLSVRGRVVGALSFISTEPGHEYGPSDLELAADLGRRAAAAVDVARLLAQERAARAETEAARARLALLADASALLGSSLDFETTLEHVAQIAVPGMADWCVIDVVQEDGSLRRLALVHADPQRELADELLRRFPPAEPGSSDMLRNVLETGKPLLLPEIPEELLERLARSPEHLALMHRIGMRSGIIVPLPGRERPLGAIVLVATRPDRRYGEADLAVAEELAVRAAAAVERARLHGELSRFRSTVDSVLDGVLMFDPDSLRFFYANHGAVNLTGYSRDELVRMTPLDLEPEMDERRFRRIIEPLAAAASSTTLTTTHRRKDGGTIMVEMFLQHVAPVGERGRVVAIIRDITDRIEARARLQRLAQSERARNAELRAIIRAMGDAVLVIEPDGTVNLANPAAESLFADAPIGRYDELVERLEDPEGRVPRLDALIGQGPLEFRLTGTEDRWVEISAYPVFTPREAVGDEPDEPDVIETIVFIRDVTEVRRSRTMRDAFIGVLSHELRTPVTTIYGNSKLLGRPAGRLEDDTRREVLADIEVEAERLYRLVEDLLVLARFERAPGRVGREPVLMQRIVPIVTRSERARFPENSFESQIEPGLPTVQADPTYVEQVVRNLMGNAAKYGGPEKTVKVVVSSGADEVQVRVLDEGPGFPDQEAGRLFELFYRSPTTASMAGGAGIGLFVCRRLIEAMGGRMWAQPRPTGGAEFGFALKVFNEESE
jgi:PAS domain S-box-containing protein